MKFGLHISAKALMHVAQIRVVAGLPPQSSRTDGTFSRGDFVFDVDDDIYILLSAVALTIAAPLLERLGITRDLTAAMFLVVVFTGLIVHRTLFLGQPLDGANFCSRSGVPDFRPHHSQGDWNARPTECRDMGRGRNFVCRGSRLRQPS